MSARTAAIVTTSGIGTLLSAAIVGFSFIMHHANIAAGATDKPTTSVQGSAAEDAESASVHQALTELANQLNSSLPMRVDENTRWDSTMALPGRVLLYSYTIIGVSPEDFDRRGFESELHGVMTRNYETSPDMEVFRDARVTLVFNYRFENGQFAARVEVKPPAR